MKSDSLQEEFAPYRGQAGVVATEGSVESLPLASLEDFVREQMGESTRGGGESFRGFVE